MYQIVCIIKHLGFVICCCAFLIRFLSLLAIAFAVPAVCFLWSVDINFFRRAQRDRKPFFCQGIIFGLTSQCPQLGVFEGAEPGVSEGPEADCGVGGAALLADGGACNCIGGNRGGDVSSSGREG